MSKLSALQATFLCNHQLQYSMKKMKKKAAIQRVNSSERHMDPPLHPDTVYHLIALRVIQEVTIIFHHLEDRDPEMIAGVDRTAIGHFRNRLAGGL